MSDAVKSNQYKCDLCGGIFEKAWSDEDALAEKVANGFADMDCAMVCDDCYNLVMQDINT